MSNIINFNENLFNTYELMDYDNYEEEFLKKFKKSTQIKKYYDKYVYIYHNDICAKKRQCVICYSNGIIKRASFGFLSDKKMNHCSSHKQENMVNLEHINQGCIICLENGIFKRASFGFLSDKKMNHCSSHKQENMVYLVHIKNGCLVCQEQGIFKNPTYGFLLDKKRTHCSKHQLENMVSLIDIKKRCISCEEQGIFKQSSFGFLSDKKKTHCSSHKQENMVDLQHIKKGCIICLENGIFKQPSFGFLSDKKMTHCSSHKQENMVDLQNIKKGCIICLENEIFKQASFGFLYNKKMSHCSSHKQENMVALINIKKGCIICLENGIFKRASFGFLYDKKMSHCSSHKQENMVDVVNINNGCIICKENGIFKRTSFGKLFEKKIHCIVHKKNNEYKNNNPKCLKCKNKPFYGDEKLDEIPQRCEEHKLETDIDIISRKCILCGDEYFIPSSFDKCKSCLGWLQKKKNNRGVKEKKIEILLKSLSNTLGEPTCDKKVENGCSNKRPDFYYKDFNDCFSLIVEVDENQHSKYTCGIQAEMTRLINIYENDNGGFPLIIIRFNPDKYYYENKVITTYDGREKVLQNVILGLKNKNEIKNKIGIIYLYYDNFNTLQIATEPLNYEYANGNIIINHKHPHSLENKHIYSL
jgi:hypothetical protein